MSNITKFAARFNANDYAYGCNSIGNNPAQQMPSALVVGVGSGITGAATLTIQYPYVTLPDSSQLFPLNTNAQVTIGSGSNAETVTVTALSNATSFAGYNTCTLTATFANTHGIGDQVSSATFGLQEAINAAAASGGGEVVVTPTWYARGGTAAMIAAATVPLSTQTAGGSNNVVRIVDVQNLTTYVLAQNSVTVVSAPSAATSATVASTTATGTWTASTFHVLFTYVTADGGESLASADYSFTATVSKAIGGTGPAAATGAVGYRVYIGANATTTCYLTPVIAANGTVVQCGPIAAFKIGTSFSVATLNVAAALPPLVQSTAFPVGFQPVTSPALQVPFGAMQGPFAATGTVTAGTAIEWAKVQIPTGYLNSIGRTLRLTLTGNYTPVSTATVIITVAIGSVYTGTETTIYTVTTPASSGTSNSVIESQILLSTRVTGASGAVRAHGFNIIGLATGTAGLGAASLDTTTGNSSAVDLTGQNYIRVTINSGTANLTTSQCDMFLVETLA